MAGGFTWRVSDEKLPDFRGTHIIGHNGMVLLRLRYVMVDAMMARGLGGRVDACEVMG
jgi:hypothetical protein